MAASVSLSIKNGPQRFHLGELVFSAKVHGKRQINYRAATDGRMRLLSAKGKVNTFHNEQNIFALWLRYQQRRKKVLFFDEMIC